MVAMKTRAAKKQARKPIPQPSSPPAHLPSSDFTFISEATLPKTPRIRPSTSNRFWDANLTNGATGVHLASDSDTDNRDTPNPKNLDLLDTQIKRLLVQETGPVRLAALATNEAVKTYTSLLDAFAVPGGKKKRAQDSQALCDFLQEHVQVVEAYNKFAQLERKVRKDRVLPEFLLCEEVAEEEEAKEGGDEGVLRAPAKQARREEDSSDEEGIVRQTVDVGEVFDGVSVFNTKGLRKPVRSIFNNKGKGKAVGEFRLHRRDDPLVRDGKNEVKEKTRVSGGDGPDREENEETPTRPRKRRKLA